MPQKSMSVSISMTPEMDREIEEEANKHGMNYSEYVRQVLRESMATPFECDDTVLVTDENGAVNESETGAA